MRHAKGRHVPGRMNATEAEYERLFLGRAPHGYEEITLVLGDGARFTPDFWTLGPDDVLEFHEVKGHWREAAKVRIRVAASKYPQFRFLAFRCENGQWSRESFGPADVAA